MLVTTAVDESQKYFFARLDKKIANRLFKLYTLNEKKR